MNMSVGIIACYVQFSEMEAMCKETDLAYWQ
jgi:hypothetical protein